ncbi:DUF4231 domain-containing protein [Candidatus Liberibacter solanacearum]|nr:DUF4231 domain-containing protein [Candidatus Liberibacter solanacearum]
MVMGNSANDDRKKSPLPKLNASKDTAKNKGEREKISQNNKMVFPKRYHEYKKKSAKARKKFKSIVLCECLLLVAIPTLAYLSYFCQSFWSRLLLFALSLIGALALPYLFKKKNKLEHEWYENKTKEESVKAISWLYCMGAPPYKDLDKAKDHFIRELILISKDHGLIALDDVYKINNEGEQEFFDNAQKLKDMGIYDRLKFYMVERVDDQCYWYLKKSSQNKKKRIIFDILLFILMTSLPFVALLFTPLIGIVLAVAFFLVKWKTIFKYNELEKVYSSTAQEINLIKLDYLYPLARQKEFIFEDFVRDIEPAFSREYTSPYARRI